ncbi:RPOM protein, partial [Sakesphorus luctuosus]|nr:RPOM protein [Sakesphorus luctuosus]
GIPWSVLRSYSSASVKEVSTNGTCERTELLKVLKARAKQLQGSNIPEVTVNKVEVAPPENDKYQDPLQKALAPHPMEEQSVPRAVGASPARPSSWAKKLQKETYVQQLKLERKLSMAASQLDLGDQAKAEAKPKAKAEAKPKAKAEAKPKAKAEAKPKAKAEAKPKTQAKTTAKLKAKPTKSPKTPKASKAKAATAWSQSCASPPHSVYTHSKPTVEVGEEGVKLKRPHGMLKDKDSSQHKVLQETIHSSLECFLFLQQPEQAERFLLLCHSDPRKRKLLDVSAYNIVMRSWARKGCLQHIDRLFSMLESAGFRPTLDSYTAALECMGREQSSPEAIWRYLQQLTNDGFHVDELFQKCLFEEDEKEKVLSAIRTVLPNYQPPPPPKPQTCKSSLLQDFYSKEKVVSYPKLDFSVEELKERFQQQLEMELNNTITIESVEAAKPLTPQAVKARELLSMLRSQWHNNILQALQKSKHSMAVAKARARTLSSYNILYPYLCLLPDEEYVGIMLQVLNTLSPQGESLAVLARELSSRVYTRYITQRKLRSQQLEKVQAIYEDYIHLLAKDSQPDQYLPREYWEKLVAEAGFGSFLNLKDCSWPFVILMRLGMHMLELLVKATKLPKNLLNPRLESKRIPVLYHIYSFQNTWQVGLIKPHPIFSQILTDAAETTLTFSSSAMPMLCPPVPWTSPHFGAFVMNDTKLMRFLDGAVQHQQLLEQCQPVNLHPVLDALTLLGNCAWKINQPVLDIIISIFNDKGNEELDIPPPLSEAPRPPTAPGHPSTWSKSLRREVLLCKKKAAEMHSLRMDALYKLSIANYVRDKVFWFPHNMDFRGRTYPCPPYFNHLGNDVTRAILLFAEGRPLGPRGLDWLKIHLINLTGLKKSSSLQERLGYANEIMEEILDSADHPLTGRKWWMNTDEPWQALACCMEIAKASRSPDPAAYISHFPVHQDGSCNGLQHYAALGRDLIGAISVNLVPCSVPQDVYSAVAQQVEEFRKKDAERGVKIAQVLQGFISRKVVKQTVMTVVYGVTRYGGRLQIEKRLKEIDDFPEDYLWEASQYLVRQVFNSIKEMFSATRDIQNWLTESAKLISQSGRTVEWVTPLGLPIVQPYYRSRSTVLNCGMQNLSVRTSDSSQKPDTVKQKNAFPPNFIHSLDSTHMMLTALHCLRQGLTFVSVHDCYWTHALTVDTMNRICRQQFVALHSEKILQDLSEFMLEKYCSPNTVTIATWQKKLMEQLSNVPRTGEFNLNQVMDSTYFFS